jgi:hypothetical protein
MSDICGGNTASATEHIWSILLLIYFEKAILL